MKFKTSTGPRGIPRKDLSKQKLLGFHIPGELRDPELVKSRLQVPNTAKNVAVECGKTHKLS